MDVAIAMKCRYLGFVIGPEAGSESWEKPLQKYISRVVRWSKRGLERLRNIHAYQLCTASVSDAVMQLEPDHPDLYNKNQWALREFALGPANWATLADLINLESGRWQEDLPSGVWGL